MSNCMAKDVQTEIRGLDGNRVCADCDTRNPQWASVTFGTLVCLECSGRHRGLGVHISFVRSVQMDSWSHKQIQSMRIGGNGKFRAYIKDKGIDYRMGIHEKYALPDVELYALRLRAERDGKALPTALPARKNNNNKSGGGGSGGMGGGETPQERDARLRREAEERMRQKFGSKGLGGIGSNGGIGSSGAMGGGRGGRSGSGGNGMEETLDVAGKHVAAAAETAGQALGQAFNWISTTTKSTVETVREKDIGASVTNGWEKVRSSQTAANVGATVSSGWSSLVGATSSLWSKAQSAVAREGEGEGEGGGGDSCGGAARSDSMGKDAGKRTMRSSSSASRASQSSRRSSSSLVSSSPTNGDAGGGDGGHEDDDAWLQQQLEAAKSSLAQQRISKSAPATTTSSLAASDADDGEGWGDGDDEDLELFLQSDDEDEEDAEGALPTSVLDMAAKSSRAPAAAEQKKKKNKKNETNKPGQEDDFFGSFGM
jgi:ADP-ribosylation factor GTPase-activating protein 1